VVFHLGAMRSTLRYEPCKILGLVDLCLKLDELTYRQHVWQRLDRGSRTQVSYILRPIQYLSTKPFFPLEWNSKCLSNLDFLFLKAIGILPGLSCTIPQALVRFPWIFQSSHHLALCSWKLGRTNLQTLKIRSLLVSTLLPWLDHCDTIQDPGLFQFH